MKSDEQKFIEVAVVGKCIGLKGELKLHLKSDFPQQFKEGALFYINDRDFLKIEYYNPKRDIVKFVGFDDRNSSVKLVNKKLYSTVEMSRKNCSLADGEYFWFDVIGSEVLEDDKLLGEVIQIDRIAQIDYLVVKSEHDLVADLNLAKKFYIPYIDRYIKKFDLEAKKIFTKDAFLLLESS
jgi:16S rRNA processing protein RimM